MTREQAMRKLFSGLAALWLLAAPAFAADLPEAGAPQPAADNQAVTVPTVEAIPETSPAEGAQPPAVLTEEVKPEAPPAEEAKPPAAPAEEARPASPPVEPVDAKRPPVFLSMDFTDVDLPVLVKFISEQTRKNFIFDEKLQGKITIISPRKISVEEAYNVFLSVLQVKGFTTVEHGNTIKIIALREAKQESLATSKDDDGALTSEFITRLIPLQYVDTTDVVTLMAPIVSNYWLFYYFH
jgi:general secretion pathway protein D